MFVKKGFQNVL